MDRPGIAIPSASLQRIKEFLAGGIINNFWFPLMHIRLSNCRVTAELTGAQFTARPS